MKEKKTEFGITVMILSHTLMKGAVILFSYLETDWVASGMAMTIFVVHKRRKITIERQLVRVFFPVKGEVGGWVYHGCVEH